MGKSNITEENKQNVCQINRQLDEAQRISSRVQEHLAEARNIKTLQERYASEFQYGLFREYITDASICAERLAEKVRRLVLESCTTAAEKGRYRGKLADVHQIKIRYVDHIIEAEIPFLLPHRKNAYTDYIYEPFHTQLYDWCMEWEREGKSVPIFHQATICFVHEYDRKLPKARIRDHDNMEEKQVVDAFGSFFLESDGGLYLDTYHTSRLGERDRTLLFLMKQEQFLEWICSTLS
ncbi:MAG: DUF6100 family protein [Monoglobales bacterium]